MRKTFYVNREVYKDKLKEQGIEPINEKVNPKYKGQKIYEYLKGDNSENIIAYKKLCGYNLHLSYDEFFTLKNFLEFAARNDNSFNSILNKMGIADGSIQPQKKKRRENKNADGHKDRADTK